MDDIAESMFYEFGSSMAKYHGRGVGQEDVQVVRRRMSRETRTEFRLHRHRCRLGD